MKIIILLALVASEGFGSQIHPLSDEFINHINSKQNTWTAGRNYDENVSIQELRRLLGAKEYIRDLRVVDRVVHSDDSDIPESFDAREQWPECKDVISQIPDQSHCGGGWAVQAAATMTDRRCIHSKGKLTVPVSAIDILTCLHDDYNKGCQGGFQDYAFDYWYDNGIVTGGLYNSSQGCKAYPLEPCDHHVAGSSNPCPAVSPTPECKKECDDPSLTYKNELTFGANISDYFTDEISMQKEILANGPIESTFIVYSDFFNYKSGVYQHVDGDVIGVHSGRIIGWGIEDDIKYWLVANGWNENWGDHGYFKIVRGRNEVSFEQYVVATLPKL